MTSIRCTCLLAALALLSQSAAAQWWGPAPVTRATGIKPAEIGVVINVDDPLSEAIAETYLSLHGISPKNRVRVSLGMAESVTREKFEIAHAATKALPGTVQALALTFTRPTRVDAYNSITSALARGYYVRPSNSNGAHLGYTNPYRAEHNHSQPWTRNGIRPAMMVAGSTLASSEALIVRGRWAEGTNPPNAGVVMRTSDFLRSIRTRYLLPAQVINGVSLTIRDGEAYPLAGPVMFYFQGRATIPDLPLRKFRPGAWTDTLTSCAGMPNGCGGQVTVWQIIDAGATGSYGTVEEPYVSPSKFPAPDTFVRIYTGGATLIEAAWRSVGNPYQGLFVGDPLAAPYAKGK